MKAGVEGIYNTSKWGYIFVGNADRFDELFTTRVSQQHSLSAYPALPIKPLIVYLLGFADNQARWPRLMMAKNNITCA